MFNRTSPARALAAIAAVAFLAACGGGKADTAGDSTNAATPPPAATTASAGQSEFETHCTVCHQADGTGMAGIYPPLAGSELVNAASPNRMIAIVLKGLTGPVTVKGSAYNGIMAAFEATLNDEQIASIVTYERSSWGNTGAAVTAAQVAELRSSLASRSAAWTIEELEAAVP